MVRKIKVVAMFHGECFIVLQRSWAQTMACACVAPNTLYKIVCFSTEIISKTRFSLESQNAFVIIPLCAWTLVYLSQDGKTCIIDWRYHMSHPISSHITLGSWSWLKFVFAGWVFQPSDSVMVLMFVCSAPDCCWLKFNWLFRRAKWLFPSPVRWGPLGSSLFLLLASCNANIQTSTNS